MQSLYNSFSGFPLLWRCCLGHRRSLSVTPTLATPRTPWTEKEDDLIRKHRSDGKSVAQIRSQFLPHRTLMSIYGRLHRIINECHLKTGTWSKEEDDYIIRKMTLRHSPGQPLKWRDLAMNLGRSSRVVRERWRNTLNPEIIRHTPFTKNELLIMKKWLSSRNADSSSTIKNVKELSESISRSEKRVYNCLQSMARSTPPLKQSETEKHS